MQFLQQAITNKNSFLDCETERATHFRDPDDGSIRPISELDGIMIDNNAELVNNLPPSNGSLPEPLPMPVMNFGDDEQVVQNDFDGLPMPKMNFDKPKNKDKKATEPTVSLDGIEPLPMPSMKF